MNFATEATHLFDSDLLVLEAMSERVTVGKKMSSSRFIIPIDI